MLKILLLDSWLLNMKVIEQDAKKCLDEYNIDHIFIESDSALDAVKLIKKYQPQIAFIDISSKQFDGIELLKNIKSLDINQPLIIAETALYDTKYRYEALKLGIDKYIYKPYDCYEIEAILKETLINLDIINKKTTTQKDSQSDEFMDFDEDDSFMDFDEDDEFMDFDEDDDDIEHSKELMDAYNDSHKKVSAKEFLEEYKDIGIDTEELQDLEDELDSVVANILFENNLEDELPDIIYMLEKYNRFLYMFTEFEELSKVLYGLIELLNGIDFNTIKKTTLVSKFIVAIIQDLVEWKEHVFILEDAVDVYYINASILNSFVQLKDIINR
ncbi:MAG: response regulator [Campylobacterota bacterium]|nr:response regulator [Campylobacterota bacterium]